VYGIPCPGCGLTRATHHLLTGDVAAALSSNLFTPFVLAAIVASWVTWTLATFGREVRNIIRTNEFSRLFNVKLAEDSRAAGRWNTDAGGAYVAAGVGTAVTGRGAHILLIDDPVKDREEAESELRRETIWNWYTSTAYTRLMPGGAVILIQTRWHEDDLGGRLLEAENNGGDKWVKVNLPAIRDGQALWPERYNLDALNRIKAAIGPRDVEALYQQNPTPTEGLLFKREWLRFEIPPNGGVGYAGQADPQR
jgi:hypothetical protein